MFRVSREINFCYGHRLLNYPGKCCHLHGHNGKLTITLLHHVLLLYRQQQGEQIPVYGMLAKTADALKDESGKLAARLRRQLKTRGWTIDVIQDKSRVGGGALPKAVLDSWVIALSHGKMPAEKIEEKQAHHNGD